MHVTLCYDSRVVSGEDSARWLTVFRSHLETPELLLTIDPESAFSTARHQPQARVDADPQALKLAALLWYYISTNTLHVYNNLHGQRWNLRKLYV